LEDASGAAETELQNCLIKADAYVSGTLCTYLPSMIISADAHRDLARGFTIGSRLDSAPVVRLADARPMQLRHALDADGRWRLVAFADQQAVSAKDSLLRRLAHFLASDPQSPIVKYTRQGADIDSVIEVLTVFQQSYTELEYADLPDLLWPAHGRLGLRDYEKTFCAAPDDGVDIFAAHAIDRQRGCLLIVRPDQHIAHLLPLDAHDQLARFFDGFMC